MHNDSDKWFETEPRVTEGPLTAKREIDNDAISINHMDHGLPRCIRFEDSSYEKDGLDG